MKANPVTLYGSSIGQKIVSAFTGLFLCAFLIVHIAGNLLLFKSDSGQSFDEYAAVLSTNSLVRGLEILLFTGFAAHIFWGFKEWLFNRRARPGKYVMNRPSENSSLFSRTMTISGSIVLIFLGVHLQGFWYRMRFGTHSLSDYDIVRRTFENPFYAGFYVFCLVLLSFHLRQGFQSAFQTFGARPMWRKAIDWIAAIFWLLIPAGFAAMPLYFFSARGG